MACDHARWFEPAPVRTEEEHKGLNGADLVMGHGIPLQPTYFDTDILNIKIWGLEKFGRVHPEIERLVRTLKYDLRLLCRPDIPWEPDPLRENPHDRDRLFDVWERELRACGFPYVIIEGDHEARVQKAVDVVEAVMRKSGSIPLK